MRPLTNLVRVAALVLACALVPAATATAAGWTTVGPTTDGGVVADGVRYVAFLPRAGVVRVRDDLRGTSFDVPLHVACVDRDETQLVDIGGGALLARCLGKDAAGTSGWLPSVLTIADRIWHDVPDGGAWRDPLGWPYTPDRVGARWIAGSSYGHPSSWIDWQTGRQRLDAAPWTAATDLDAPQLFRPMCQPLERPLVGSAASPDRFGPFQYEEPYGVGGGWAWPATIQRCGQARTVLLDPASSAESVQLGDRIVTWDGGGPRAYLPQCDVRLIWDRRLASLVTALGHTRDAVFVGHRTVDRLALPRDCGGGLVRRLTVTAGGRRVGVRAGAGTWTIRGLADAKADVVRVDPRPAPAVAVRRGTMVALRTDAPARTVRWRLDGGRWHAARRLGRDRTRWALRGPAVPNPVRLIVEVRYTAGGHATFALRAHGVQG